MSIIQSYPKGTPKADDMLLGTVVPKANSDDLPVTRNFSITDVASFSVDNSILKLKEITITAAQMLALNGGGVIDLIPAAGAGQLISILNMAMFLDYGGTVYNFATTGLSDGIAFKLGAVSTFHTLSASTELNITQDRYTVFDFPNNDEMVYEPNTAFTLTATSGVTVSQGNSPIKLNILYRIVNFT
tara:strand:+ start:179 stop:739 length:561 start_codon:yes stop_codon:yes gene_type:complete